MIDVFSHDESDERLRLRIDPHGEVHGDDGADGLLAAGIRYAARQGVQMGVLGGLGDLRWLTTWSGLSVTVRTSVDDIGLTMWVDIAWSPDKSPGELPANRARGTVEHNLMQAVAQLDVDWAMMMTPEGRLVSLVGSAPSDDVARGIGTHALAILSALAEPYREVGIAFDYAWGQLFLAEVVGQAVVLGGDRFDSETTREGIARLRSRTTPQQVLITSPPRRKWARRAD